MTRRSAFFYFLYRCESCSAEFCFLQSQLLALLGPVEPSGDRSQNDPHPEVEFFACRANNLTDPDPEETSHSNMEKRGTILNIILSEQTYGIKRFPTTLRLKSVSKTYV